MNQNNFHFYIDDTESEYDVQAPASDTYYYHIYTLNHEDNNSNDPALHYKIGDVIDEINNIIHSSSPHHTICILENLILKP
jgi:hypothetical protein